MPRSDESYTRSGSTDWEWKKVKLAGPRPGKAQRLRSSLPLRRVAGRDHRKPLHLEVRYVGGAEAEWILKARGHEWRLPGHRSLHDALLDVNAPFFTARLPD